MVASHPDGCPAQTWDTPAARVISLLSTVIRDLPMIRLRTSPIKALTVLDLYSFHGIIYCSNSAFKAICTMAVM